MTMTISEAMGVLDALLGNWGGMAEKQALAVIRSRLEVKEGHVLKTPGEVDAWFGGFAACESAESAVTEAIGYVHPAYLDGPSVAMEVSRVRLSDKQVPVYVEKAALVAALGDSHGRA